MPRKKLFFAIILTLSFFVCLELCLRFIGFLYPHAAGKIAWPLPTEAIEDQLLGFRPNPQVFDHDRNGFRNPFVPQNADIVALGDSHTYGTNVASEEAWPKILEKTTGRPVYSMSFGGWSPAQGLLLWDSAMAFHPRILLQAFYAGNDLFDVFSIVYSRKMLQEFKTPSRELQSEIAKLQEREPLEKIDSRLFASTKKVPQPPPVSVTGELFKFSKLFGMFHRVIYELQKPKQESLPDPWPAALKFAQDHPGCCEPFEAGPFKTIFTSPFRFVGLNLEDPRIQEGLQISLRILEKEEQLSRRWHCKLLIVLLPTKEMVFAECNKNPSNTIQQQLVQEDRFRDITKMFLEKHHIDYVETLPELRACFHRGIQPYPVTQDGHPNREGHKAIARAVAAFLETLH